MPVLCPGDFVLPPLDGKRDHTAIATLKNWTGLGFVL